MDHSTIAIGCLVFGVLYIVRKLTAPPSRPTYSLHPLCPSWISGIHAAYSLGADETRFILYLRKRYGTVVYIPFPLSKHFVLEHQLLKKIYDGSYSKQLSFIPIRIEMSGTVFGTSKQVLYDQEARLEKKVFPIHTKSLTSKTHLEPAIGRFIEEVDKQLDLVAANMDGKARSVDLVQWAFDIMFEASRVALFGYQCPAPSSVFKKNFLAFDNIFPLLASDLIPPFLTYYLPATRSGVLARDEMNNILGKWAIETGCVGLAEGDVVKDMADESISHIDARGNPHWTQYDVGSAMLGDLWALLANNPYATCWSLIYLIQADDSLRAEVLSEVDSFTFSSKTDASDMPLLTSIIYETLRLHTSPFSIRRSIGNEPFIINGETEILPKENVIVAPRAIHLDEGVWGEDYAVWNPKRFYDIPGSMTNNASKMREVRAFGGGSSMCEGRTLALAEMRIFLASVLKRFTFELGDDASTACKARSTCRLGQDGSRTILVPAGRPGRPGLGTIQIDGAMPVRISLRKSA